MEYDSLNQAVIQLIPGAATRVLDLGCGRGSLGAAIRARGAQVTGVTFSDREAESARAKLDAVVVADLNDLDLTTLGGPFDCVICSHILEHLYRPDLLLTRLRSVLTPVAAVVVALPNVLVWRQRVRFLTGRFRYTDGGLMDRTHYRFFDWGSAHDLLIGAGYQVEVATAEGVFPAARFLPGLGGWVSRIAVRLFPGLFGWQFLFLARSAHQ